MMLSLWDWDGSKQSLWSQGQKDGQIRSFSPAKEKPKAREEITPTIVPVQID